MPSIQPHGEKLQSLRKALGLTQLELALRAGVSERTVRNAEQGRPLKREFLQFLAAALGVELQELVRERAEVHSLLTWQENVAAVTELFDRIARDGDATMLRDYMHPELTIELNVDQQLAMGGLVHEFRGVLRGLDGAERLIDLLRRFDQRVVDRKLSFEKPVGDGDTAILRGFDELTYRDGRQDRAWWFYVYEFQDRRIVRAREYNGIQTHWPAEAIKSQTRLKSA